MLNSMLLVSTQVNVAQGANMEKKEEVEALCRVGRMLEKKTSMESLCQFLLLPSHDIRSICPIYRDIELTELIV